jgi:hypothetical protein
MRGVFIVLLAVPAAVIGWWALYELIDSYTPSEPGSVPLLFALLFLALTATVAPAVAFLNQRLAPLAYKRDPWRVLRHSAWIALCLASWGWLQMQRAFNLAFALIIAMIFVAIEVLIVRLKGG